MKTLIKQTVGKVVGSLFTSASKINPRDKRSINIGGQSLSEQALLCNLICFGAIGSGKTAAVIRPFLKQFSTIYNSEDSTSPNAKWGGLIIDLKGDQQGDVLHYLKQHGRSILDDVVIIRPNADYVLAEFEDLANGNHFFVAATGGLQPAAGIVLKGATGEGIDNNGRTPAMLQPDGTKVYLESSLFQNQFRLAENEERLKSIVFHLDGKYVPWIGWEEKNNELLRIVRTIASIPHYAKDKDGIIRRPKPSRVKYIKTITVNNGITFNLIDPKVSSTQAANKVRSLSSYLSMGSSFTDENGYWGNAVEQHMARCIELTRQVEPRRECSLMDIQLLTSNEVLLQQQIGKLKAVILKKQQDGVSDSEVQLLHIVLGYFTSTWMEADAKVKERITSCINLLIGDIVRSEELKKVFCSDTRLSFKPALDEGKVYILEMGTYPNAQSTVGNLVKTAYQAEVLTRAGGGACNKTRMQLFLSDDYHWFINALEDAKFLSITRQLRICNVMATSAIAHLLSYHSRPDHINAFLQSFRNKIFMQNLDDKTNKLAASLSEHVGKDKVLYSGEDLTRTSKDLQQSLQLSYNAISSEAEKSINSFMETYGSLITLVPRKEDQAGPQTLEDLWINRKSSTIHSGWDAAAAFTKMGPFEAVIHADFCPEKHQLAKVDLKSTASFLRLEDTTEVTQAYYKGYLENRLYDLGAMSILDCKPNQFLDYNAQRNINLNRKLGEKA